MIDHQMNKSPQEQQSQQPEIIMRAESITKVFPGTVALDNVDFNVYKGKVNVLIGENGAGKTTLMKILSGVEQATNGRVLLEGNELQLRSPLDATKHGIGIIFQELTLCPNLTVHENIFLAREKMRRKVLVDQKNQKQLANQLIQRLEQKIDPNALVGELRIGQQQIVEITKALAQNVSILIMDEPTSALSAAETEVLFKVINDLRENGVSIIYISHKLEELLGIGDYITILRDGKLVCEVPTEDVTVPWIIEKMVGQSSSKFFTRENHHANQTLLQVDDISLPRAGGGFLVNHVSFKLNTGEILGIYGLMGAGRSDLLDCLAGSRPDCKGKITLNGEVLIKNSVTDHIKKGIVLIPEDRQSEGLVPTLSVANNMILSSLKRYLNKLFLSARKEKKAVGGMVNDLRIRISSPSQLITSLSGGNQQKVVVAKGLLTQPAVLLMDEPTRGIDVGAKSEIFEIMNKLAMEGYGVIFVSSELKEVLAMSDRILVMAKGAITGEYSHDEATEEKLVAASAVGHELVHFNNHNGVKKAYESS
jgi:erythritol transport system ATP-binding protein